MSHRKKFYPLIRQLLTLLLIIFSRTYLAGSNLLAENPDTALHTVEFSVPDSATCQGFQNETMKRFVRLDHQDGSLSYYYVRLSMFNSFYERGIFYEKASNAEIYIVNKAEIDNDSALFMTGSAEKETIKIFSYLYEEVLADNEHRQFNPKSTTSNTTCETALVSCSGNSYTFPANPNTNNAPPPILGYPDYGCLGSGGPKGPSYYYMQISVAGNIIIHLSAGFDVDFICWGAFQQRVSRVCDGSDRHMQTIGAARAGSGLLR